MAGSIFDREPREVIVPMTEWIVVSVTDPVVLAALQKTLTDLSAAGWTVFSVHHISTTWYTVVAHRDVWVPR